MMVNLAKIMGPGCACCQPLMDCVSLIACLWLTGYASKQASEHKTGEKFSHVCAARMDTVINILPTKFPPS